MLALKSSPHPTATQSVLRHGPRRQVGLILRAMPRAAILTPTLALDSLATSAGPCPHHISFIRPRAFAHPKRVAYAPIRVPGGWVEIC